MKNNSFPLEEFPALGKLEDFPEAPQATTMANTSLALIAPQLSIFPMSTTKLPVSSVRLTIVSRCSYIELAASHHLIPEPSRHTRLLYRYLHHDDY
jgi:hypothetical protein